VTNATIEAPLPVQALHAVYVDSFHANGHGQHIVDLLCRIAEPHAVFGLLANGQDEVGRANRLISRAVTKLHGASCWPEVRGRFAAGGSHSNSQTPTCHPAT
jgi:hypothetical protein